MTTRHKARAERDAIRLLLQKHPEGLTVEQIAAALLTEHRLRLDHDKVRYRLATLGVPVEPVGEGRYRPYRLVAATTKRPEPAPTEQPSRELSTVGDDLRRRISRPMPERAYVTYRRPWLDSYKPNTTQYLTDGERQHLRTIGTVVGEERPAGTYARDMLSRLLIDLSWASSRLEGNTYSLLDTELLIEFGTQAEGKDARETQMILNHKKAIEFLVDSAGREPLSVHLIRSVHAILAENLLSNAANEGRLRDRPVRITNSAYLPTEDPHLIRESLEKIVELALEISDPFERSFFLLVHLPYLQPFVDVNKRTARIIANLPLIEANVCPLTFVDIPEDAYVQGHLAVYELQRTELLRDVFLRAYARSAERYRVVQEAAPAPNPLRTKHRTLLEAIVRDTVRSGSAPARPTISIHPGIDAVSPDERDALIDIALELLVKLNDASASRYGLRPSEFESWRKRAPHAS